MSITYRRLSPPDAPTYRAIRLRCLQEFPGAFGSSYAEEVEKEKLLFESHIETEHPENFLMAAFDAVDCIGICGFLREAKLKTRHRGHILQMCVLPGYQGRGIGRKLLARTIDKAFTQEGLEQIILGVVQDNASAGRLYEQLGFVEYGLMPGYMKVAGERVAARLMMKMKA